MAVELLVPVFLFAYHVFSLLLLFFFWYSEHFVRPSICLIAFRVGLGINIF